MVALVIAQWHDATVENIILQCLVGTMEVTGKYPYNLLAGKHPPYLCRVSQHKMRRTFGDGVVREQQNAPMGVQGSIKLL